VRAKSAATAARTEALIAEAIRRNDAGEGLDAIVAERAGRDMGSADTTRARLRRSSPELRARFNALVRDRTQVRSGQKTQLEAAICAQSGAGHSEYSVAQAVGCAPATVRNARLKFDLDIRIGGGPHDAD
jgi:ParB-like chromosome segregation protein Spo0J